MARLLRDKDYERALKSDTALAQIVESNWEATKAIEQSAQAEMISYLAQRYKTSEVFSNTTQFDITAVYKAKNLVEYTETTFSTSATYRQGERVVHAGYIYEANTSVVAGAFDSTKWDKICADKALFYVSLPHSEYDSETSYAVGDKVWYNDKVYTCRVANTGAAVTESYYWGTGASYAVTGTYPDDDTVWSAGDNRNQQIVMFLLDITLYHLYCAISPRNVPDLRKERYNGNSPNESGGAIGWLKAVAKGNVQADLPVITPSQGLSMRYGSAGTYDSPSNNMLW